ncbi:diguanylate cyclase [Arenimonas sp. MALMAid1274]|uniref:sensor domain-containing diguanylate cyclase n=1 Tax=Arenimonas sp. MALMAid1274 TaxID=3411630 RepID=UPI003B9ED98C
MRTWFATLAVAAWLCLAASAGAAAPSPAFEAMLRQAEQVRSADPQQFQALLGQLNSSVAAASPRQREQLRYLKAYHLAYTGRTDLAIKAAKALFDESQDAEVKFRAGSLIVNSYAITREFGEGLRYLDQTLALTDQISDAETRHHGWSAAAILYNQVGQYEQGLAFAERLLADQPSPRTRCFAVSLRLESLYHLGPLPDEDAAIEAMTDECQRAGEVVAASFVRGHLARRWAENGQRPRAIMMLLEHLPEVEATRYPRLIGEIHSLLGVLYLQAGDSAMAKRHARLAVERSAGMSYSAPLVDAYRVLYESAVADGDTAAALEHHINYAAADKAYLDSVKARELAYQMVRNETQQKTQTIELLNNQNRVLQLEQQVNQKSRQATRLLIALLAVLLASIAYWAYKIKRMQVSLRHLAQTDALTGISNRRHFTDRAAEALAAGRKSGQDIGLVMLDLDNFKAINDQYGHAVGDWALKQVALVCGTLCRKGKPDLAGRLGGEEFAFLLVDCELARAAALAQEARKQIAAIDTASTGHVFRITASFGVAGTRDCGHDLDALLARADDALYRSKREGRDRVSIHAGPLGSGVPLPLV